MSPILSDGVVKWVPYCKEEKICEQFSPDDWHKIVHDIKSDKEFGEFLKKTDFIECYVLKFCSNNKSIAFLYTIQEDVEGSKFSIHGGAWGSPLIHYRGYILMIKHLFEQGFKVRTYCQSSNSTAIRFNRSVGFIPYRYTEDEVFMWISEIRLKNSKIYKRFHPS